MKGWMVGFSNLLTEGQILSMEMFSVLQTMNNKKTG